MRANVLNECIRELSSCIPASCLKYFNLKNAIAKWFASMFLFQVREQEFNVNFWIKSLNSLTWVESLLLQFVVLDHLFILISLDHVCKSASFTRSLNHLLAAMHICLIELGHFYFSDACIFMSLEYLFAALHIWFHLISSSCILICI